MRAAKFARICLTTGLACAAVAISSPSSFAQIYTYMDGGYTTSAGLGPQVPASGVAKTPETKVSYRSECSKDGHVEIIETAITTYYTPCGSIPLSGGGYQEQVCQTYIHVEHKIKSSETCPKGTKKASDPPYGAGAESKAEFSTGLEQIVKKKQEEEKKKDEEEKNKNK